MPGPELVIPVGTQVVSTHEIRDTGGAILVPARAVGVIVSAPSDAASAYRVRFPSGAEASLRRSELVIREHDQRGGIEADGEAIEDELRRYVVYRCIVGSRAYDLDDDASDTDRRGFYVPPASLHWSLSGVPEQLEDHDAQQCYWEVQKFLTLALKANPNALECLYTPLVELATPLSEQVLAERAIFLSMLIYQTYNGYVMSQFKKMEQDLRTKGAIRLKHAMHLIRLLLSGIFALREGHVPVRVSEHRELLLAIKRGEMAWEDVDALRLDLHRELDVAYAASALPERPDYARANDLLVRIRRAMVD